VDTRPFVGWDPDFLFKGRKKHTFPAKYSKGSTFEANYRDKCLLSDRFLEN
jgi:hypothetical protein